MKACFSPSKPGGRIAAIPSKSDAHRVLIAAALADGPTRLKLPAASKDIDATVGCLRALGAAFSRDGEYLTVAPAKRGGDGDVPVLDCIESGSTLRFLLPVAAALRDRAAFEARSGLARRPLTELVSCMEKRGVSFSETKPPLEISGFLQSGEFELPGNVSSQYISGLLFALPLLERDSVIRLTTPLQSSGYVDMTLDTLRRFSIEVQKPEPQAFVIPGSQRYRSPGDAVIEGDWSNAAFFLAMGAISAPVTVTGLSAGSYQKDREIISLLERFGASVSVEGDSVSVLPAPLYGISIDAGDIPDLVPVLAVCAAAAHGTTTIYNAGRLRIKESDRLESVAALIGGLGGDISQTPDGLVINGTGTLRGGAVDSFNDHRIAMSAAVAACFCTDAAELSQPMSVEKSYPAFYEDYKRIGGIVNVIRIRQ